jgi:hypothetical protein
MPPRVWILALILAAAATPAGAETYVNARFGYQVDYPADLLTPQGEAANGDGQRFVSHDNKLIVSVWGTNNALETSVAGECAQRIQWEKNRHPLEASYKAVKSTWFVYTGLSGKTIVYEKAILSGDVYHTVRLEYPAADKAAYDAIVKRIVDSFRPGKPD